jgi:ABC-2 type transport system ATP-binding protein
MRTSGRRPGTDEEESMTAAIHDEPARRSGTDRPSARVGVTAPASSTTTIPAIRAVGLGRRFGDRWAVEDLDLELKPGEVFGLLGPNGAGKTTTVRMLAGLIAPSVGRGAIDGIDVATDPEAVRARIGILTETPGLYDRLTARQNLEFFGQLHGMSRTVRDERIERLLRLFELWDRQDGLAGTFSKGMKQKLAIARALLHDPSVLFLDEPTSGLDPEAAFVVREAIESLRSSGRTIVLATHNLDEAERLADRIGFLRGRLLRVDSPARLRDASAGHTVEVGLAGPPSSAVLEALRSAGATDIAADGPTVTVTLADARRDTPRLVRALVAAGADVLSVVERTATLESIYFDVMGIVPDASGGR